MQRVKRTCALLLILVLTSETTSYRTLLCKNNILDFIKLKFLFFGKGLQLMKGSFLTKKVSQTSKKYKLQQIPFFHKKRIISILN